MRVQRLICSLKSHRYVIDLRSKLIMVEIPAELELEIPNLRETIDAFSEQLQVISEMRDALFELYTGGHFRFQARYEERHRFDPSGLAALQESLASLRQHIKTWNSVQKAARDQFYYMNYFTMREVGGRRYSILDTFLMMLTDPILPTIFSPHEFSHESCISTGIANDGLVGLSVGFANCSVRVASRVPRLDDAESWASRPVRVV
jgi:hypothetical protein